LKVQGANFHRIRKIFKWISIKSLTSINPNIVTTDFDSVGFNPYHLIHHQFTGGHVILPAVPGTGYGHSVEFPLPQRPASVQASVMDGVKLVSNIRDGKSQAVDLKFPDRTRWNFVLPCGAHKTDSPAPSTPA